jgi:hypothetical protein
MTITSRITMSGAAWHSPDGAHWYASPQAAQAEAADAERDDDAMFGPADAEPEWASLPCPDSDLCPYLAVDGEDLAEHRALNHPAARV